MPNLDDIRYASEAELASKMKRLSKRHRKKIYNAIKQYGGLNLIPGTFWLELQKEMEEEAAALLLLIFIAAHEITSEYLGVDRSEEQVRTKAEQYAKARAASVAEAHIQHTADRLRKHIEASREQITNITGEAEAVKEKLSTVLGDERAEGVAVTETTSGISGGQIGSAEDYLEDHPDDAIRYIWRTEKDERVCPICAPLHGKRQEVWAELFPGGPPAHPNCRCELVLEIMRGARTSPAYTRGPAVRRVVGRLSELTREVRQ